MPTKNQILNDPCSFAIEELHAAIQNGVVTYYEIADCPDFSNRRRRQLQALLNGNEEEDWAVAEKGNTVESYQHYLTQYPQGRHCAEANLRIKKENERIEWESVPQRDIVAVQTYLDTHPMSAYKDEAHSIILEYKRQEEYDIWERVDKDSEYALQDYIYENPNGAFTSEARQILYDLQHGSSIEKLLETIYNIEADMTLNDPVEIICQNIRDFISRSPRNRKAFVTEIQKNKNLLPESAIRELIEGNVELEEELTLAIGWDFIKALNNRYGQQTSLPSVITPEQINRTSTEFYFWGIPASGKTCLMASLLSAANRGLIEDVKGMRPDSTCSGYKYLTYLMDFFSGAGNVLRLMPGNGQGSVAEMGFDLIDSKKRSHPITFIDMPGEAFKAMHKELARESVNPFKEDLDVVKRLLVDKTSNSNQKVHIFVVEYGAHNKKDADGVSQQIYLQSAAAYIKAEKIFEKKTDMICIIFTKADLAEGGPASFKWKEYLDTYYHGFYTNLCEICETNEINNGEPVRFWFSIGEVCFRSFCKYNEEAAHKVLNFIVDRTWRHNKFRSIFSK